MNPASDAELEIVYQDEWLVAINKPAGLLVHRSEIDKHETRFAVQMLREQLGSVVFTSHRLDKPTSGLLLFALDKDTQSALGRAFEENRVSKQYEAIVRGYTPDTLTIDYPLALMNDFKGKPTKTGQQDAITQLDTVSRAELPIACSRYQTSRYSLVRLQPQTGRKHQLRRHMKHIFHPIVGDTTHGDGKHNQLYRVHFDCHRLLLAATELELDHPVTGDQLLLKCTAGEDFERVTSALWP